jgi:uncharacterized membrane protein YukC
MSSYQEERQQKEKNIQYLRYTGGDIRTSYFAISLYFLSYLVVLFVLFIAFMFYMFGTIPERGTNVGIG